MATSKKKRKAKSIRYRTAVRRVVNRIRKLVAKSTLAQSDPNYCYSIVSRLTQHELQLAINHASMERDGLYHYGSIYELNLMYQAMQDVLLEKAIGLSDES